MSTSQSELESLQGLVGARYHLLELLGKKSGRRTLWALDQETNQRVVIKLLTFGEDFAWDDLKLFEREAETLRSLDHPAIPKYLDFFDVETERSKGFALVQSYIDARSLSEQMEAGRRFSEGDLVAIAQQLLDILDYLHSQRPPVIHRDIKPSNILLTDRSAHSVGQVYLVDFGSVQTLAAREGSTMTVVGTYGYMPPEQFGGRTVPASDLYALGATLIYLASGQHPADLPQQNLRLQFESRVSTRERLKQWLAALVEPSLDQRWGSVKAASSALHEVLKLAQAEASDSVIPPFSTINKAEPSDLYRADWKEVTPTGISSPQIKAWSHGGNIRIKAKKFSISVLSNQVKKPIRPPNNDKKKLQFIFAGGMFIGTLFLLGDFFLIGELIYILTMAYILLAPISSPSLVLELGSGLGAIYYEGGQKIYFEYERLLSEKKNKNRLLISSSDKEFHQNQFIVTADPREIDWLTNILIDLT